MTGFIFFILAGLVALGFLIVVWRNKKMPAILRVILVLAALGIVAYVGSFLFAVAPK